MDGFKIRSLLHATVNEQGRAQSDQIESVATQVSHGHSPLRQVDRPLHRDSTAFPK